MGWTRIHWKKDMLDVPVFHVWTRVPDGSVTSETRQNNKGAIEQKALNDSSLRLWNTRLGENAGVEGRLTSYCWRRNLATDMTGNFVSPNDATG